MIGKEIPLSEIRENYFFINGTYVDIINKKTNLENIIREKYTNKELYKLINKSYSITFIGDSLTEGTKNNFHPWYEPLIFCFKNKKIINISKGSYTTFLIIKDFKYHIIKSKSNLYIIALGTNDVRYRNRNICAMTASEYINNMKKIVKFAKSNNKKAKFVFIAPWLSIREDNITKLNEKDKNILLNKYSLSLKNYCQQYNYLFIDPNPYIFKIIKNNISSYIYDQIHPNENEGIELYSKAVIINSN